MTLVWLEWQSIKPTTVVLIINLFFHAWVRKLIEIAGSHGLQGLVPQQLVTSLPHVITAVTSGSAAYGIRLGPFQMPGVPASMSMAMPAAAIGYLQNQGAYHSECSWQSKKVFTTQALSHAGNTINLIVQFGHEVQASRKTKLEIINVREANDFMSSSSHWNILTPFVRAFRRDATMFLLIQT